jgi:hypothetical protein
VEVSEQSRSMVAAMKEFSEGQMGGEWVSANDEKAA